MSQSKKLFTARVLKQIHSADTLYLKIDTSEVTTPVQNIATLPATLVMTKEVGGDPNDPWSDDEKRIAEKDLHGLTVWLRTKAPVLPCNIRIYPNPDIMSTVMRTLGTGRTRKTANEDGSTNQNDGSFDGSVSIEYRVGNNFDQWVVNIMPKNGADSRFILFATDYESDRLAFEHPEQEQAAD